MISTKVFDIFSQCVEAILQGHLISRVSKTDKEFHFQDWFEARLQAVSVHYDKPGRNSYPDFSLVQFSEGYKVKGLEWPGRESSYDCNSQVPTGFHNGREIYYVFGRYPKPEDTGKECPVIDLVICHGDFLNANHEYVHKNRNVKGFGSYGDIMIRDRKMYVAPTPFEIAGGLTGTRTLILPSTVVVSNHLKKVGDLVRSESASLVIGYDFDLFKNTITARTVPNPNAGSIHTFAAYRIDSDSDKEVLISKNLKTECLSEGED
jgi:hypothetical protein